MSKDHIRYDLLAQDALRGVVRKVLADVARLGALPGDHHFFIAFATTFPGVRLSQRLREQYPQEMTIVLQHQYWDLAVTEHAFEVGLSFGGAPERLLVPFQAITQFFDPSTNFGLKFEVVDEAAAAQPQPAPAPQPAAPRALAPVASVAAERTARASKTPPKGAGTEPQTVAPASVPRVKPQKAPEKADAAADEPPTEPTPSGGGAQVVSLDKFRKK